MLFTIWPRIARSRRAAIILSLVFVLAVFRFAGAVASAVHFNHGDFENTLPGPYAEQWNLKLWDSPDLRDSVAFHRHSYGYGPTQYLTLWPIVFLDSYRQIAAILLPVYVAIVLGTGHVLGRIGQVIVPERQDCRWGRMMCVYASVFLFGPILVALGQREFEVVQGLIIVAAAYLIVRGRAAGAGALLGYISMFKYWVLALLAYFVLKRQWKAVVGFMATAAGVLLVAHALFDLGRFPFADRSAFDKQFGRIYTPLNQGSAFCPAITGTAASVANGLCILFGEQARFWFYGFLAAGAALFLLLFMLLERQTIIGDAGADPWRRCLEFSFLLFGAGVVFHAHYYYLSILILPLAMALYRNLWRSEPLGGGRFGLALAAYVLLSAFVAPIRLSSRIFGRDMWSFYLAHGIYLYGYAALVVVLFWEYGTLVTRAAARVRARAALEHSL
jgi:hypothetical protein